MRCVDVHLSPNAAIILLPRPPHPGIGGADAGLFASCSLNNFAPGSGDTRGDSLLLSKLVRAQFLNCTCSSDIIFHSKWPPLRLVRSEFGTFPEGKKNLQKHQHWWNWRKKVCLNFFIIFLIIINKFLKAYAYCIGRQRGRNKLIFNMLCITCNW